MELVNLTPHTLNILRADGSEIKLKSEGLARVASSSWATGFVDGISVYETSFGEVEGLPEERHDTYLVVSRLVLQAAENRKDLLSPGQLVRNEAGQPIGCQGLSR